MSEWEPTTQPWIVCAACRNSKSGTIVAGARHFDKIMKETIEQMCPDMTKMLDHWRNGWTQADQGFIDQWGRFYERDEALQLAQQNEQCFRNPEAVYELYSEDLY